MAAAQEELACKVSAWVAGLLASERASINQLLMQHHDALLFKLGADLRGKDGQSLLQAKYGESLALAGSTSKDDIAAEKQAIVGPTSSGNLAKTDMPAVFEIPRIDSSCEGESRIDESRTPLEPTDSMIPCLASDIKKEDSDLLKQTGTQGSNSLNRTFVRRIADHPLFEAFFVTVILVNTVFSAFQGQYRGLENGYLIHYEGYDAPADTKWPGAGDVFEYAELVFAAMYTIELVIKIVAFKLEFVRDRWSVFDFALVAFWYLKYFKLIPDTINPMILRLCRLARLMRLVRHVGWFEGFDSLFIIIKAIKSSFSVLVWATIILATLLLICSLCMSSFIADYLENVDKPGDKKKVYEYFGTFTRSLVTIFEISFASHVPVCRVLMENVHEAYAIFFMVYKLAVGLSVFKVITGVFLHETFKVCSEDDELMIIQRKRNQQKYTAKMKKLFAKIDERGDGTLSWEEFDQVMRTDEVRMWLGAMDLDTRHPDRLWRLLDDGDGSLTAPELVKGISHLKGPSKSADMHHLIRELADVQKVVTDIHYEMRNRVHQIDVPKLPPLDPACFQACTSVVANPLVAPKNNVHVRL